MIQKALDIQYSKQFGTLNLVELNQHFEQGWTWVDSAESAGGDIIAIIQHEDPPDPNTARAQ